MKYPYFIPFFFIYLLVSMIVKKFFYNFALKVIKINIEHTAAFFLQKAAASDII